MALFENIPGWKVFSTGIGIAALALLGYFGWKWFVAGPDDLKRLQHEATVNALDQVAEVYAKKVRGEGEQRVIVMPVVDDTSNGQIRMMLMDRLNAVEGVKADVPRDPTLEERATAVLKSLLDKNATEKPDPTAVFEQSGEADEVISVDVVKLWSGADSGICTLDLTRIVRAEGGERIASVLPPQQIKGLSGTALPTDEATETGPSFWSQLGGFLWRALVVLAAAAIMPFLSWPLAKAAFARDSNALNGALLVVLTGADLLVLFALVSFEASTAAVVSAGLLLPAALIYNLRMLNFIEER